MLGTPAPKRKSGKPHVLSSMPRLAAPWWDWLNPWSDANHDKVRDREPRPSGEDDGTVVDGPDDQSGAPTPIRPDGPTTIPDEVDWFSAGKVSESVD